MRKERPREPLQTAQVASPLVAPQTGSDASRIRLATEPTRGRLVVATVLVAAGVTVGVGLATGAPVAQPRPDRDERRAVRLTPAPVGASGHPQIKDPGKQAALQVETLAGTAPLGVDQAGRATASAAPQADARTTRTPRVGARKVARTATGHRPVGPVEGAAGGATGASHPAPPVQGAVGNEGEVHVYRGVSSSDRPEGLVRRGRPFEGADWLGYLQFWDRPRPWFGQAEATYG